MSITDKQFHSIKPGDFVLLNRWTERPDGWAGIEHLNGAIIEALKWRNGRVVIYMWDDRKATEADRTDIAAIKRGDSHEWVYEVNDKPYKSLSLPTVVESFPECMCNGNKTRFSCVDSDGEIRTLTGDGLWMGMKPFLITPIPAAPSPERLCEIAAAEAEVERMEAHLAERKNALKAMKEGE